MAIKFQSATVNFTSGPDSSGQITGTAQVDFSTTINTLEAAFKSFRLGYDQKRYVYVASARITDVKPTGVNSTTASCTVTLQMLEDVGWTITIANSSAEVLFIADCK